MKKSIAVAALALSLMGLTACAGGSSATPERSVKQSGIEGVSKIELRYERIPGNISAYIYCLDTVAYLGLGNGTVATPQYDSLCLSKR